MEAIRISLEGYKNAKATVFTGRPQGESVREELDLNKVDRDKEAQVVFVIPGTANSFNPSFYLGLLYPSYKTLGLEGFEKKYSFVVDSENPEVIKLINRDLEDGKRSALNSLNNKSIFDIFR